VSILVNGIPIDDSQHFSQGDPLAPFAFATITEGLYRVITKVVADGKFKEYKGLGGKFNRRYNFVVRVLLGELWCTKAIQRGFDILYLPHPDK